MATPTPSAVPAEAIDRIESLTQRATEPRRITDDLYVVTVPSDGHLREIDIKARVEAAQEHPNRAIGTYTHTTVESFVTHVEQHIDKETSFWVHPTDGLVVAVLNDTVGLGMGEGSGDAGWRDHRSELRLRKTPEWEFWLRHDGRQMDQTAFAEHIEDGLTEIAEPPAAVLLELAQTFQATTAASFRQASRLRDGSVQVKYEEQVDAKAGQNGDIEIPAEFTLYMAPFIGEERHQLTARLRYRLRNGDLSLGYKLDHPERIVDAVTQQIVERLAEAFGAAKVFTGDAPRSR